jgi:hypothetical protein
MSRAAQVECRCGALVCVVNCTGPVFVISDYCRRRDAIQKRDKDGRTRKRKQGKDAA